MLTTDSSDTCSEGCCAEAPDMGGSRPASPREEIESGDDRCRGWSSPSLAEEDKDDVERARERPAWLSSVPSPSSSTIVSEASRPSLLWSVSSRKGAFWPAGWTGMFHQGSA